MAPNPVKGDASIVFAVYGEISRRKTGVGEHPSTVTV